MEILKCASAGTLESSDVMVTVIPSENLSIEIESPVLIQFGDAIRAAVSSELERLGVTKAAVTVADHGALDCTIRARVETAVKRASKQ